MSLKYCLFSLILLVVMSAYVNSEMCPVQCDCDMDKALNRATCVNQNIINVDMGVPTGVQIYSLSHNVISELENYCFKNLGYTSIQVLNLSYNTIFWIGLHAFSGLNNLVDLNLSYNRLRYIPLELFWNNPNLAILDLSGNMFEKLKNEPFLMHLKLEVLNLNHCHITSLPDRLFTRLPNLKKLDLSENYIVTINTELLHPLKKLERLELQSESLECTPYFIAVETWIVSHQISYEKQCRTKLPQMSEKMISAVVEKESRPVDVNQVWNRIVKENNTLLTTESTLTLTPLQKFNKEFPAIQAFIIGLEIGLAVGIVATYIWLERFCACGQFTCKRPQTRRQIRRAQRLADGDMRTNLLWTNVTSTDLETPPTTRRELSLPERFPPFPTYGLPSIGEASLRIEAIRPPDRAETPPPPYNECRFNT